MRVRTLVVLFFLLFAGFLVARLPLSAALRLAGAPGLQASAVTGTIWQGDIRGAVLNGRAVGDIRVAAAPLDLGWHWRLDAPRLAAQGVAVPRFGGVRLVDVRAQGPLGAVLTRLPVDGALSVEDGLLVLGSGGCAQAAGRVSVTLAVPGGGTLPLAGDAGCADGRFQLTLAGQAADGPLSARLVTDPRAPEAMDLRVLQAGPDLRRLLDAAGFTPEGDHLALSPPVREDSGT